MIATDEQLQNMRFQEIKEYLFVGASMGGFSGLASIFFKSNNYIPYLGVGFAVLLYIAFEAYRVQGEVFLYHFQRIEYLSFFVSSFLTCGSIQVVMYYYSKKYS